MATRYRLFRPLPTILLTLLLALPSASAERGPKVVYDSDFDGYVPVVGGIERPDLVVGRGDDRFPATARQGRRKARRGLRRERKALRRGRSWPAPPPPAREADARWEDAQAIVTELFIHDSNEQPVPGARVYRYSNPSFYPVNESSRGSRLFGSYRYLPYAFPAHAAQSCAERFEESFRSGEKELFQAAAADLDEWHNPWLNDSASAIRLPLEYVGTSDLTGRLRVVTGLFNVRDPERFPRAIVPSRMRVGFVVLADGYQSQLSERPYERGGLDEERSLTLLHGPGFRLFGSRAYQVAERLFDAIDLAPSHDFDEIAARIDRIVETLKTLVLLNPREEQQPLLDEAETRLISRLFSRAPPQHFLRLARRAVALTPNHPGRIYRLARALAAVDRGDDSASSRAASPETASEREAEMLLRRVIELDPEFLPALPVLDELLLRKNAELALRTRVFRAALEHYPFERFLRARLAGIALDSGHAARAFDHLRYTWAATPGLGQDQQLARSLADYYWRMGLPEKAGTFTWLLTGHAPEDPFVRVRQASP